MSATVVSIFPFQLPKVVKPTLYPGEWDFPVSTDEEPAVLVIGDNVTTPFFNPLAKRGQEYTQVPVIANEIAKAIVEDQLSSMIHVSEDASPGLFWVPGEYTPDEVSRKFSSEVAELKIKQKRWFAENVKEADDLWGRFRQHRVIARRHVNAARFLGLKREWCDIDLTAAPKDDRITCKFCTTLIPEIAIVCPNCKQVLKKEEYEELVG